MAEARAPCACGRSTHKASAVKCRLCLRDDLDVRRSIVLAALGATGITETAAAIAARSGLEPARARGALASLVASGEAARVGRRYFPRSWAP